MEWQSMLRKQDFTHICFDEPLSEHTTFRVGGPADVMVFPHNREELGRVLAICREAGSPWFFLGKGSNLLVNDEGFRGVVICPEGELAEVRTEGCVLTAGCAVSLAHLAAEAQQQGLTGLEFASGIPGTFGGGIYMNAGAYGGEMCQVLTDIVYLDEDGEHHIAPEDAGLGYRTSCFQQRGGLILGGSVTLQPGDREQIMARMKELNGLRRAKQPLEYPSAGSMFKRPEGYFAGKLIQDAGLAGFTVGGAQVSSKHCGFVINRGGATAADITSLVHQVTDRVYQTFGVRMQPEVRYLGPYGLCPWQE
ncbi:MAG: UDP-N-acetylmuramate dehydrogenase [Firmicutes bacterium]|nr:UDP-N-acetylmuramate dehydrogenase [Bacillota bacterium]